MLVHHQPVHLYDVYQIAEDVLEEGEEGVVCHYAKYPLRYTDL
jgi:hypothetical protein